MAMFRNLAIASLAILLLTASFAFAQSKASDAPSAALGRKLFSDKSLGTNGKSCASCHSESRIPGIVARGTWFGGRAKTLEQAVNMCITSALDGKRLPEDSPILKSIAMYMKSVKASG